MKKLVIEKMRYVVLAAVAVLSCSCEPKVLPATPHAVTSPDQVKIYQKQPKEYEDLGTLQLEITPELRWDQNGEANAAFDLMRSKAAALGANGLLLQMPPQQNSILTLAGYHGAWYQVPMIAKTAYAKAIFVVKE